MKSRQFVWLLLLVIVFSLPSYASYNTCNEPSAQTKVFIVLRSEENQFQLEKFKESINKDLMLQNVSVQIEIFRRSEPLPQARIFKKAYSENYDIILLIDQVTKYNIDNRVTNTMIKVGGKYKIRSYNLKKSPYTWIDHGDSNCNLSIRKSIRKLSNKILGTMDLQPIHSYNYDDVLVSDDSYDAQMSIYNQLIGELEEQKNKTIKILNDIRKLKNELDNDKAKLSKLAGLQLNRE